MSYITLVMATQSAIADGDQNHILVRVVRMEFIEREFVDEMTNKTTKGAFA